MISDDRLIGCRRRFHCCRGSLVGFRSLKARGDELDRGETAVARHRRLFGDLERGLPLTAQSPRDCARGAPDPAR